MNTKYLKIGVFIISSLVFQILVILFISIKGYVQYEVLDKPKLLKSESCLEVDEQCVSYCNEISDAGPTGTTRNCDASKCCFGYDYVSTSVTTLIIKDLKFFMPLTFFGVGLFFSAFATDYISKKYIDKKSS